MREKRKNISSLDTNDLKFKKLKPKKTLRKRYKFCKIFHTKQELQKASACAK